MNIHLITDLEGKVFGLYKDRQLIKQKQRMHIDDVLNALGVHNDLIVFNEEEMKAARKLPPTVDEIPIDGVLGEAATIETVETAAALKKREKMEAGDYAKEYIRMVENRVDPDSRASDWDEQSKWVEETITRLVQSAIEEDRKSRECCNAEREACAEIAETHTQWPASRGIALSARKIAQEIRARSES